MAIAVTTPVVSQQKNTAGSVYTETKYQTEKTQETVIHVLTDDGSGTLGTFGTVNYAGKSINVRLVDQTSTTEGYKSDYENATVFESAITTGAGTGSAKKGGTYSDTAVSEELLAASTVTVTYATDFLHEQAASMSFKPPVITIDLCPLTTDYVVPNSVRFTWMGHVFEDFDGVLVRGRTPTDAGFVAGQINYSTGIATITDYVVSGAPTAFSVQSLWTVRQKWTTASIFMRTQAAPLRPSGFVMNLADSQGNSITATADNTGTITGTHLRGRMEYETGIAELQFGDYVLDSSLTDEQKAEWWYDADDVGAVQPLKIWRPWPVDPTTLRYNSVAYFYLPIDAAILGLDPVRLPQDGRVPIYRAGGHVVIGHSGFVGPVTVTNGQTIDTGRERLSRVRIVGSDGLVIHTGYVAALDAGLINIEDVTGWAQPVKIEHRIEQLVRIGDVQIDGTLSLVGQLAHDFPVGSVVSTALITNNLMARVLATWDQATWTQVWTDTIVGAPALASYNATITVTNAGAITQRWVMLVRSSSTFECIGEYTGSLGIHSMNVDFAPVNDDTGVPFFTLPAIGWGEGWIPGNALFVPTVGAMASFASIRTTQMGPPAGTDYEFELLGRGDVDRPPSTP